MVCVQDRESHAVSALAYVHHAIVVLCSVFTHDFYILYMNKLLNHNYLSCEQLKAHTGLDVMNEVTTCIFYQNTAICLQDAAHTVIFDWFGKH